MTVWQGTWLRADWRRSLPRRLYVAGVVGLALWLLGAGLAAQLPERFSATGRYQQDLGTARLLPGVETLGLPPSEPARVSEAVQSHDQLTAALERLADRQGLPAGLARSETIAQWAAELRPRLRVEAWHDAAAGAVQFTIRVADRDPARATQVVEALAEQYGDRFVRGPQLAAERADEEARQAVDAAQIQVAAAEQAWDALVEEQWLERSRTAAPAPAPGATGASSPSTPDVDPLAEISARLAAARAERDRLAQTMTPLHPLLRELDETIAELTEELAVAKAVRPAPSTLPENSSAERAWEEAHRREYDAQKAELAAAREAYAAAVAQARRTAELRQALAQIRVGVLAPARLPERPEAGSRGWLLSLVTLASLAVGLVVSRAAIVGQSTLWTPRQVEALLKLPTLGTVSVPGPRAPHVRALPMRRLAVLARLVAEVFLGLVAAWLLTLIVVRDGFATRLVRRPLAGLGEAVSVIAQFWA